MVGAAGGTCQSGRGALEAGAPRPGCPGARFVEAAPGGGPGRGETGGMWGATPMCC